MAVGSEASQQATLPDMAQPAFPASDSSASDSSSATTAITPCSQLVAANISACTSFGKLTGHMEGQLHNWSWRSACMLCWVCVQPFTAQEVENQLSTTQHNPAI